jgi:WD40 repeat protein
MNCEENYMPDSPYKGLRPYSEADRLFFFGREKDRRIISDNLQASRLTVLYGASGVGKSSVLRASVAYHLRQAAKANVDKYGKPGWAVIVFPPVEGELADKLSWQDPLTGIESQVREEVEQLVGNLRLPEPALSLVETLQAWTGIVQRREGGGKLFIILDQFEEYFNLLPKKGIGDFAEEFCKAVNDPDLNVHFLVAIREDSLAKLDYFKGRILKFLNNRLEIKHLDWGSARQAIEKPIDEYNRQQTILDSLCTSRLTVLYGDRSAHKSTVLREGIAHYLRQAAERNLKESGKPKLAAILFDSWHDEKPLARLLMQVEAEIKNLADIQPPQPGLSFVETLQEWTKLIDEGGKGKLFIILEQFEQYFLNHPQEVREETFAVEFFRAVNHPNLNLHWLISIREDRLSELDRFREDISKCCDRYLHLFPDRVEFEPLKEKLENAGIVEPSESATPQERSGKKSIAIDPELVEEILDDVRQTGPKGTRANGSSEARIETPYLQLVMHRLWKEEMSRIQREDKEWQEGKRADPPSRQLQKTTYTDKLGGAETIVREHLYNKLERDSLSESDREAAARIFNYLVTPSGAKIAQKVSDLVEYANENLTGDRSKLECEPVRDLLEKLTKGESRILRRVGSSDQPYEQHYEIFHDVLGRAVLEWRRAYLERKQKEDLVRLSQSIVIFAGIGVIALLGWQIVTYQQKVDRLLTVESQQTLEKFDAGQQLIALQEAMRDGQWVQTWVKNNPLSSIFLDPDKKQQLMRQSTFTLQQTLRNIQEQNQFSDPSGQVQRWDVSRDWKTLAIGSADGTIQVWELQTGRKLTSFQASREVRDLSFSPDSQTLVTSSVDGTVQRWDWQTDKHLTLPTITAQSKKTDQSKRLRFSHQGQTLAINPRDGIVQVWNWETDRKLGKEVKPSNELWSFNLSPDGQTLATATDDGTVQVWDVQTGNELASFKHKGSVSSMSFSREGKTLAIATDDGKIELWHWQKDKHVAPFLSNEFKASGRVLSLWFSPDDRRLATGLGNGTLSLWILTTDAESSPFRPVGLGELLIRGCQRLRPYLESHPKEGKDLHCPSTIERQ